MCVPYCIRNPSCWGWRRPCACHMRWTHVVTMPDHIFRMTSKKGNEPYFVEGVIRSWFLGKECHQSVLPPVWDMMMFPHDGGWLVDHLRSGWPPMLHLCCCETGWPWAFAGRELLTTIFKFPKEERGAHCPVELVKYIYWKVLGPCSTCKVLQMEP